MKDILTGDGAARLAVGLWITYQVGAKLIDIGMEIVDVDRAEGSATIAEYIPLPVAPNLKIVKDEVTMGTIAPPSVLTMTTINVCVEAVIPPGTPRRGPWMHDDYKACNKNQYVVTIPVLRDAYGKATIGTPTVAQ